MQVLSWNIQWGRGCDGRVDLARTAAEIRRVGAGAEPEVICLQEVADGHADLPGGAGEDQYARLAALLPGHVPVAGVATDTAGPRGRRRFGNLILSRLPVLQVFVHLLPWPATGAKSMQRCVVEANLRAPWGGVLRVLCTHLEYYDAGQRTAQVERLRELHREAVGHARRPGGGSAAEGPFEAVPRGQACIVVGDFNCPPDSAELARLRQPYADGTPGLRDAWALLHPQSPHPHTVGLHDREQWPQGPDAYDHAFVSEDLAPRVRAWRVDPASTASDHQPVVLVLDDRN